LSVGRHIEIRGVVQGVGFRPWVYKLARTAGLTGSVSNNAAGVVIDAFAGAESELDAFVARLRADPPPCLREHSDPGDRRFHAQPNACPRCAPSLRGLSLAGGDRAIKDAWRAALALLDDAFDGDPPLDRLSLFDGVPRSQITIVRRMIAAAVNAPIASGAGRYFDAFGALGLGRARASFEGQVAMAWEQAADASETRPYPFAIDTTPPVWRVDLRPAVRAVVSDLLSGRPASSIAARFHETLAAATADVVWMIVRARGAMPVVLTGGCFQNVRLTEGLARSLGSCLAVYVHRQVPPGDGGIALGQLAIADAILRKSSAQTGGVRCA
jgi:hydrogenase maturation factor HypF (carbamoyltransferase family)